MVVLPYFPAVLEETVAGVVLSAVAECREASARNRLDGLAGAKAEGRGSGAGREEVGSRAGRTGEHCVGEARRSQGARQG